MIATDDDAIFTVQFGSSTLDLGDRVGVYAASSDAANAEVRGAFFESDGTNLLVRSFTGTDITSIDVNDEATLTSDALSLDQKAAVEISVKWVEGNDGACDGDVLVYVLRDTDGTNYQTINDAPDLGCSIDATQNTTRYKTFTVSAAHVSSLKILVDNDSGQDGDLTIKYRFATVTTA